MPHLVAAGELTALFNKDRSATALEYYKVGCYN